MNRSRKCDTPPTHTLYGILLSHKKNEVLPFAIAWIVLEGIMPSKRSQLEKDKNHMVSLICGILKNGKQA